METMIWFIIGWIAGIAIYHLACWAFPYVLYFFRVMFGRIPPPRD